MCPGLPVDTVHCNAYQSVFVGLVFVKFPEDFLKTLIKHCRRETNLDAIPDPLHWYQPLNQSLHS